MAAIVAFECSRCGFRLEPVAAPTVCPKCAGVLYVRYDFSALKGTASRDRVKQHADAGAPGMWRYSEVLPDVEPVTLAEGWTPMLRSRRYPNVWLKEEGANPTGTFKARGMAAAISMLRSYGVKKIAAPSAGNAGGAMAAYAAAAGMEAHIFMPKDVPLANQVECTLYGAHMTLVDGLISDCGRIVAERKDAEGWFDLSTLKEPFRVEGKKTMGYELVEQLGWEYPDAVFYPTGGGVGLIGMWKAFEEMEAIGWKPRGSRPKMVSVQAEHCAPIVKAFEEGKERSELFPNARTVADGLRVPKAIGDFLVLRAVRESGGTALSVSDADMVAAMREMGSKEGISAAPEGGAAYAAIKQLVSRGDVRSTDTVVLFNAGGALKYLDVLDPR
jgi:threonine synthase